MKILPGRSNLARWAAFTLLEMMIAIGGFIIAGGIIFEILTAGVTLSAKNSAVNQAHQQTRQAADRLVRDIHNAISVPALLDANRVPLPSSVGPAAGIGFMLQSSPVLTVAANATATQNTIQVTGLGSFVPRVGQRFFIPTHQIEADIVAVNGNTLTLATNLGVPVQVTNSPTNFIVLAYVADLVEYILVGNELRFYPSDSSSSYSVVARNQMISTPFGLPFGPTQ